MLPEVSVGIALACIAMLCWGFGDWLIQKSTRRLGNIETLFIISIVGALILLPFIWKSLPGDLTDPARLSILILASVVLLVAAVIDFEALRQGKLSIVEPIWSLEVPVAAVLAFVILGEHITSFQITLLAILVISLMAVSFRGRLFRLSFFWEKGVLFALLGALAMGATNFIMGWGARMTDPLTINFFTDIFLACATGLYLWHHGRIRQTLGKARKNVGILLPMSIADKCAWVAFVYAMVLAPIGIATALSESYIIITVILGLYINKERLERHQKIGLVTAILSAIILASITTSV